LPVIRPCGNTGCRYKGTGGRRGGPLSKTDSIGTGLAVDEPGIRGRKSVRDPKKRHFI